MKKLKRICALIIAIAFLLNSVPYPAYAMKNLQTASPFDENDVIGEEKTRWQIIHLANNLKSNLVSGNIELLINRDTLPGFKDVRPGELYLRKYDKVYPSAYNFLKKYGGDKQEYAFLKELAEEMKDIEFGVGETEDEYIDIDREKKQIVINADFLDFLFTNGRKKIAMSFIAGTILKIRDGLDVDTSELETLVTAKKQGFFENTNRLDDTKQLYQSRKKIVLNDTPEGASNPYFLSEKDIELIVWDAFHRGKTFDKRRLKEYLRQSYGYYGQISEEKAEQFLEEFYHRHSTIVNRTEGVIKDRIGDLKRKLDPDAIIKESVDSKQAEDKKVVTYGMSAAYIADPAFAERTTIWDIEVERQDEVLFGGKSAHTGEMTFIPQIVELPNFFTSGATFQQLFVSNTTKDYLDHIEHLQKELEQFVEEYEDNLNVLPKDLSEDLENELFIMRVLIEDGDQETVLAQVNKTIETISVLSADIHNGDYENLKDYFTQFGAVLGRQIEKIQAKKTQLHVELDQLKRELRQEKESKSEDADFNELENRIANGNEKLEKLQLAFEEISAEGANKLLLASRFAIIPIEISQAIEENLVQLADRLGTSLEKLLLAIRSSAVGEDSETASFAGRQDTYIFIRPIPTKKDLRGLKYVTTAWLFNQASLFNKRAIDYRFREGLPVFDEDVQISTLFQTMFLSELSFIAFSVDRETGFPAMSIQWTEGQGELLVSGAESGSKYIADQNAEILLHRSRGERHNKIVETSDSLGKQLLSLSEAEKKEFAISDLDLVINSTKYFNILHEFYQGFPGGSYVDLEGALRAKRDNAGNIVYLRDPHSGKILLDERGFARKDWSIASTQVRPETVISLTDPDVIILKKIVVTDAAFAKAEKEGKVLNLNFIARSGGTAQGPVQWVLDKNPESLASTTGHIMLTERSDPDMNSAMEAARGIVALKGGPNSHTMIVASEYGLVAITGTDTNLSKLVEMLANGTEITVDAERGKILLGMDHELVVAGKDFNIRDIPDTEFGEIRSSTITASLDKAFKQGALSKIPSYKGIGLLRLELILAEIGVYPNALLAYDNLLSKETGLDYKGPVMNRGVTTNALIDYQTQVIFDTKESDFIHNVVKRVGLSDYDLLGYCNMIRQKRDSSFKPSGHLFNIKDDSEKIAFVENELIKDADTITVIEDKISGYNSAEDFYTSVLSENITAIAETLIAPRQEVIIRVQNLQDLQLQLKVLEIVENYYEIGLGHMLPLQELNLLLASISDGSEFKKGSDAYILTKIIGLVDKRLYVRATDFKVDEYEAVVGAEKYLKDESNSMKGFRGLDYLLDPKNEETLRWQLRSIKKVAEIRRTKIAFFVPVARRPEDMLRMLKIMNEEGLTDDLIEVGIMTELPTNSINIADFIDLSVTTKKGTTSISFTSTGGNDGLQTVARVDRNASDEDLQNSVTAFNASVLRWNANIAGGVKRFNQFTGAKIKAGYCGNDPSLYPDYGVILKEMGYDSVSVVIESYEEAARNLTKKDFQISEVAKDAVGFSFDIQPEAIMQTKEIDYAQIDIGELRLALPVHYQALKEYDEILAEKREADLDEQGKESYFYTQKILRDAGYGASIKKFGVGMRFYHNEMAKMIREAARQAAEQGKILTIGTDNIRSIDYRELPLGQYYEPEEANPDYGVHGLVKVLNHDRDFTSVDLEIIKDVDRKNGNVNLVLNVVRSYQEIEQVNALISEAGLDISVGIDVAVPANLFEIEEILDPSRKISFISVSDPFAFTSDLMALEQNNANGVMITAEDVEYQLMRPLLILATAAVKTGKPFYIDPTISTAKLAKQYAQLAIEPERAETSPSQHASVSSEVEDNPYLGSATMPQFEKWLDAAFAGNKEAATATADNIIGAVVKEEFLKTLFDKIENKDHLEIATSILQDIVNKQTSNVNLSEMIALFRKVATKTDLILEKDGLRVKLSPNVEKYEPLADLSKEQMDKVVAAEEAEVYVDFLTLLEKRKNGAISPLATRQILKKIDESLAYGGAVYIVAPTDDKAEIKEIQNYLGKDLYRIEVIGPDQAGSQIRGPNSWAHKTTSGIVSETTIAEAEEGETSRWWTAFSERQMTIAPEINENEINIVWTVMLGHLGYLANDGELSPEWEQLYIATCVNNGVDEAIAKETIESVNRKGLKGLSLFPVAIKVDAEIYQKREKIRKMLGEAV